MIGFTSEPAIGIKPESLITFNGIRRFQPGDYVKVEFKDEASGESEWMWVVVDSCDDEAGLLFGRLDNEPLLDTALHVGDELAVSYGKVVEHMKAKDFEKQ